MKEKYRGEGEWKITKVAAFKYSKGIRVSILFEVYLDRRLMKTREDFWMGSCR